MIIDVNFLTHNQKEKSTFSVPYAFVYWLGL